MAQLQDRTVNPINPGTYKKKQTWAEDYLIPPINEALAEKSLPLGKIETFGTHNTIILLFKEVPVFLGRFPLPPGVKQTNKDDFGWKKIESWVITHLFKDVKQTSKKLQRHVDAKRPVHNGKRNKFQGIEIKYMNGHAKFPPTHVRSSYAQFDALVSHSFLDPSGYVVISKDYHRFDKRNKIPSQQLLTVWFVPITDISNWHYQYSNNISIQDSMDSFKTLKQVNKSKQIFSHKLEKDRIEGKKPEAEKTSTPGQYRRVRSSPR